AAIRRERPGADGRGTAGGGMERPGRGPDYGVVAGEEESGSEERAAPAAAGVRGLLLGGDGGAEAEALAVGNPLAQERVEAGDGRVRVEPGQRSPVGDDDRLIRNDVAAGGAGLHRSRREGRATEHGVDGERVGKLAQRREHGGDEVEGVPGAFRRARMARESGDLDEHLGPAAVPDAQVAAGRLAEDDGGGPDL